MKIMIIGCGRMGAGLALFLTRSGHQVTVIDNDPSAFERLDPGFPGRTLMGDALGREVLIEGEIGQADALAALTPNDSINLVVVRLAREMFKVPKVIARMYDPRQSGIYRRLGVQTISPVTLSVQRLSELLTFSRLDIIHSLGSGDVGLVESEVPPLLVGRMVQDISIPNEIQVVAITRGGKTIIPTISSIFQNGDMVHIAVLLSSVGRLKSFMGFS
ncbi:TrkA family potassium uptake protein [uncultured Methanoregula sp.]|uniref:potassium channel family protein n=1 Tax=uncultured Methanoregula sp. TaxID=1005933 RepID=UPI002AAC1B36|nr:TrkA family potassium uptake protein [uncultured Methanoregula sp.]